jgi:STE24 endopeptidase
MQHITVLRAHAVARLDYSLIRGFVEVIESLVVFSFMLPRAWAYSQQKARAIDSRWGDNEYVVSMVFVMMAVVFETIKSVPWSLYSALYVEQSCHIDTHAMAVFFADTLKSLVVMLITAPPVLICVVYILHVSSSYMPIYLWTFIFSLQMLLLTIFPTFIAPMFDKYEPLEDGNLKRCIQDLACSVGFPSKRIVVKDGSRDGGHANAHLYGFGQFKRIVLYDTLLKVCSERQVVAILAHELGHWKLHHTTYLVLGQQAIMLAQFTLFSMFRNSDRLLTDFGFADSDRPVIISLTIFMSVIGPVDKLVGYLFNLVNRRFEFQADNFAAGLQYATPLKEALQVLNKKTIGDFATDPMYSQYYHSHPTVLERIRAMSESGTRANLHVC